MPWTSRAALVEAALTRAVEAGVNAGAQHYANEVKRGLAGGYTSGRFVTGNVMNSVRVLAPAVRDGDEVRAIVGSDVLYALFWELGHVNIFVRQGTAASSLMRAGKYHLPGGGVTGTYQRVEIWMPTLLEQRPAIRDRMLTVAAAYLRGLGAA